jgi:hypothetical protein
MQKIFFFLSLDKAMVIPIYKQVGSEGGIVIVIKSSPSLIKPQVVKSPFYKNLILIGNDVQNPATASIAITPKNFIAST